MNTFDYITLRAFKEENSKFFEGGRIIKIQQPSKCELILTIKNKSETKKFYINISSQIYHICFADNKTLEHRNIVIPQRPPMFCMLLRKYIERCKIIKTNIPYNERIFEMIIDSYNELNQEVRYCLTVELMGKHSNIILYNFDTKIIIGCAHNIGEEKNRYRELLGGIPYIEPPRQDKINILNYNGAINYDELNTRFIGISNNYQLLFKNSKISLLKIKDYFNLNSPIVPVISNDTYSIYSELLPNGVIQDSVNSMIDNYYSNIQHTLNINIHKKELLDRLTPLYKKTKDKLKEIEYTLKKRDTANIYKKYGDIILANLYNNNDYISNIQVKDWENNTDILIKLDSTLTLKENAQKFYKLYNKSKNKIEVLTKLKSNIEIEKYYLKEIIDKINSTDNIKELKIISENINNTNKQSNKKNYNNTSNIKEIKINNYTVYIGQNKKQNDYIVSKLSSANDYWFHIKDSSGSHVLLKNKNNKTPDKKTIYECCKLAKEYSECKHNKKSPVIYTQRKYIKKPPKANLGYVIYKNETEIIVGE